MMSANIELDFEAFKGLSKDELIQKLEEATLEAIDIVADLIIEAAKATVRVDTGTLRSSIRKEMVGNIISIVAGGSDFINPKTKKPCDYAPYIERHYPFMRPALELYRNELIAKIVEKVDEKLKGITVV